jgi:uncharacterized Zn-binding protein involved in type VI secretion
MKLIAAIFVTSLVALGSSSSGVSAQPSNPPATDIDCNAFTKQGPDKWIVDGEVHFKINGVAVTLNNSTITAGTKTANGVDLYALLDSVCGGH